MKPGLSETVFIIDRSGSMAEMRQDAIGGFNTFLADLKQQPGENRLSCILFDTDVKVLHLSKRVADIKPMVETMFVPRGQTALLDTLGNTIDGFGQRFAKMAEDERPSKVNIVVLTDGKENASKRFSASRIHDMIEHQSTNYSWEFTYLGTHPEAFNEAGKLGISNEKTFEFEHSRIGIRNAFDTASKSIRFSLRQNLAKDAGRKIASPLNNDTRSRIKAAFSRMKSDKLIEQRIKEGIRAGKIPPVQLSSQQVNILCQFIASGQTRMINVSDTPEAVDLRAGIFHIKVDDPGRLQVDLEELVCHGMLHASFSETLKPAFLPTPVMFAQISEMKGYDVSNDQARQANRWLMSARKAQPSDDLLELSPLKG